MSNVQNVNAWAPYIPVTFEDKIKYCQFLARTNMVPKEYQGKADNIFIAAEMGAELGFKPLQALQNISVINGKPSLYGDGIPAILRSHPQFEDMIETFENNTATCIIKRRNQSAVTQVFSEADARTAGLWKKAGPWTTTPRRMLQIRARTFAARDSFADALKGISIKEEVEDYDMKIVSPDLKTYANKAEGVLAKLNQLPAHPVITDEHLAEESESAHECSRETEDKQADIEERVEISPSEQLAILVVEHDVPQETVDKWLHAAKVSLIQDMEEDQIQKCITYIQDKF